MPRDDRHQETAAQYLRERAPWLKVVRIPTGRTGQSFDIAIVIDGSYAPEMAGMLDYHIERFARVLETEHIYPGRPMGQP